ncbi:MAG: hypothetical protein JO227_02625 [Acetobacteraceae bacterium]|nr:hypothetical protein [Acetobacteraceae bacterium]
MGQIYQCRGSHEGEIALAWLSKGKRAAPAVGTSAHGGFEPLRCDLMSTPPDANGADFT